MNKKIIPLFLMVLFLGLMGCVGGEERSFTDNRYYADLYIKDGSLVLKFTKDGVGGTIEKIRIERYIDEYSTEDYGSCSGSYGIVKDEEIKLNCLPKEPGKYYLRFTIHHRKSGDYKPASGETCLKYGDGTWDCESGATLSFTIK